MDAADRTGPNSPPAADVRLLVESVADYAIYMLDPAGVVTTWNAGAERAKGYAAEEIIGQHFSVFYTDDDRRTGHPQHELRVAAENGSYTEEGWRLRKDGARFWADVAITALHGEDGELVGYATVTRDVTDRMRAQSELRAAADERSAVMAVTAHELRTPVSIVNGFAQTLLDNWDDLADAERLDMVRAVIRGGERLGRLVEDLLVASRIQTGAMHVEPVPFDVGELVTEVVHDVAGAGLVDLDAPPATVVADRGRVQQMVGNYVVNALHHGAPPVSVSVRGLGDTVEVRVCDRGAGVPEELRAHLFERYAHGPHHAGTGLGLYIVRELARLQGGDAWYEAGDGPCFAFRLPSADTGTAAPR